MIRISIKQRVVQNFVTTVKQKEIPINKLIRVQAVSQTKYSIIPEKNKDLTSLQRILFSVAKVSGTLEKVEVKYELKTEI